MPNPFDLTLKKHIKVDEDVYHYYSLPDLNDARYDKLPFCIRILLESAIRNCDEETIPKETANLILDWHNLSRHGTEIVVKPSRVILQDFTGVPALVDLAAMRDVMTRLGADPSKINPLVPVDLVIDHSVQVDKFRSVDALEQNLELEMHRNRERFVFLKWGATAFKNFTIVPPGAGIVHQVNLEYLTRVVFNTNGLLYPDFLVGTDSHTPMVNGLGVLGWGVGGIEAEAVMLDQPISMILPECIGFYLHGDLPSRSTSTDLVLFITSKIRKVGAVDKFIEFYGPGLIHLSIADRATISNMSPEMGCTVCYFPVDKVALEYLHLTGRTAQVPWIERYLKAQRLWRDYSDASQDPEYSSVISLDLSTVIPALAGPKRPHDYVPLVDVKEDFIKCLLSPIGFKGFAIPESQRNTSIKIDYHGKTVTLKHGSVVIAAITSCTNTSNPNVMVAAGLLAKKAVEAGLSVSPHIKTSLAPGSGVVTLYLQRSGLLPYLETLGFNVVGYGCTTCIGNSGPLPEEIAQVIESNDLVAVGVLSGNRNFEGRIHASVRANYLASPPLVVAYALVGNIGTDWDTDPMGFSPSGDPVYLRDIWPSREEISRYVANSVLREMFVESYSNVIRGTSAWNSLEAGSSQQYQWDEKSTYIHNPPFFRSMKLELDYKTKIDGAMCLLNLGDSITTDHISPAGSISRDSPAAKYLLERGVKVQDFNSYGARRGNDQVMARGTFANIRLINKLAGVTGPKTIHHPTGRLLPIFDAAQLYLKEEIPLIILAGEQYGSGSSRDWAAKGVWMLNVVIVIAQSYERIHRSNLTLFGIVPLQFKLGESADVLGLTGKEIFHLDLGENIRPGAEVTILVDGGVIDRFQAILRFDTDREIIYFKNSGVLNYVVRQSIMSSLTN